MYNIKRIAEMSAYTHYRLLSIRPGATNEERLYVGLLADSDDQRKGYLSERRLHTITHLFDAETAELVLGLLRDWLDHWLGNSTVPISEERMSYLNVYSNNLISLSHSHTLSAPLTDVLWEKLIERFFGERINTVEV